MTRSCCKALPNRGSAGSPVRDHPPAPSWRTATGYGASRPQNGSESAWWLTSTAARSGPKPLRRLIEARVGVLVHRNTLALRSLPAQRQALRFGSLQRNGSWAAAVRWGCPRVRETNRPKPLSYRHLHRRIRFRLFPGKRPHWHPVGMALQSLGTAEVGVGTAPIGDLPLLPAQWLLLPLIFVVAR